MGEDIHFQISKSNVTFNIGRCVSKLDAGGTLAKSSHRQARLGQQQVSAASRIPPSGGGGKETRQAREKETRQGTKMSTEGADRNNFSSGAVM